MRARTGKIARLPLALRDALNLRLLEGQSGRTILKWLNALPETAAVIAEMNAAENKPGGQAAGPVEDRNLSDWRNGGFQDWLRKREHLEHTRELAQFAAAIAAANGGSLSEGAAAIAAGKVLELLEAAADAGGSTADLKSLVSAVADLRAGDLGVQRVALERSKLDQKDRELSLAAARFQRDTCELFLKWSADEAARSIAAGSGSNTEKIDKLGRLMFGEHFAALQSDEPAGG